MHTSPEPERDDLDEWIGKVLKAGFEDIWPPEQVWQCIARELAISTPMSVVNNLPDHGAGRKRA